MSDMLFVPYFPSRDGRLGWDQLNTEYDDTANETRLYFLSDRQVSVLLSVLSVVQLPHLWDRKYSSQDWRDIRDYMYCLEHSLMSDISVASIASALESIATALAGQQCCDSSVNVNCGCGGTSGCGSGGAGGTSTPPTGQNSEGGVPPDGFDTYSEYLTYRCDVATYIYERIKDDIQTWQGFNWASIVTATLGQLLLATALTPIPGDEIVVLVAMLSVVIVGGGLLAPLLDDAENTILSHKDNIICALMSSASVDAVIENYQAAIWAGVEDQVSLGSRTVVYQVLKTFGTTDNFNSLFERDDQIDYPLAVCATCNPCDDPTIGSVVPNMAAGSIAIDPLTIDGELFRVEGDPEGLSEVVRVEVDPASGDMFRFSLDSMWYHPSGTPITNGANWFLQVYQSVGGDHTLVESYGRDINDGIIPINQWYEASKIQFGMRYWVDFRAYVRICGVDNAPNPVNSPIVDSYDSGETNQYGVMPGATSTIRLYGSHFDNTIDASDIELDGNITVDSVTYVSANQIDVEVTI